MWWLPGQCLSVLTLLIAIDIQLLNQGNKQASMDGMDSPHRESISNNLTAHWQLWPSSSSAVSLFPRPLLKVTFRSCHPVSQVEFESGVLAFTMGRGEGQVGQGGRGGGFKLSCRGRKRGTISHDRSIMASPQGIGPAFFQRLLIESQCQR